MTNPKTPAQRKAEARHLLMNAFPAASAINWIGIMEDLERACIDEAAALSPDAPMGVVPPLPPEALSPAAPEPGKPEDKP